MRSIVIFPLAFSISSHVLDMFYACASQLSFPYFSFTSIFALSFTFTLSISSIFCLAYVLQGPSRLSVWQIEKEEEVDVAGGGGQDSFLLQVLVTPFV